MKKLLRIDTSTRKEDSHSRDLSNRYEKKYKADNSDVQVVYRDLSTTDIPHLSQSFIEAMYTSQEDRDTSMYDTLALSDTFINELRKADTILLSVPMYNFSIPSSLKAYIDHISRLGETFTMDENGFNGLLVEKELIIMVAYGAIFDEMKQMDFIEPYLKSLFGFLGFTDIKYYAIEGTSMLTPEILEDKKRAIASSF